MRDPQFAHPGTPLVLLCRFASVHDGDEVDRILPVVRAAFESLRPAGWTGYWPDADDWLGRRDFRDFPYDGLRAVLAAARRTVDR